MVKRNTNRTKLGYESVEKQSCYKLGSVGKFAVKCNVAHTQTCEVQIEQVVQICSVALRDDDIKRAYVKHYIVENV